MRPTSLRLDHAPSGKVRSPAEIKMYKDRRTKAGVGGGIAVGTLVAIAWLGGVFSSGKAEAPMSADDAIVCTPSGRHEITVQPGEGIDNIVMQIEGSGMGEGDACWSEAQKAVQAVAGKVPQEGARLMIPNQMLETRGNK